MCSDCIALSFKLYQTIMLHKAQELELQSLGSYLERNLEVSKEHQSSDTPATLPVIY